VALTGDGKAFMWGANKDAQLGTGGRTNSGAPRELEYLQDHNIVDVKGGAHTLFLTSEGRLFVCGRGREGQLGRGDSLESVAGFREDPVEVTSLHAAAKADGMTGNVRITAIGCGRSHSAAIVSNE
jgi:alpha-tubulin suppressor-like RCC1 family protein